METNYGYVEVFKNRVVSCVKVGDEIKIAKENDRRIFETCKVTEVYPYYVRALCENGYKCLNIGDLVKLGKEPSGARIGMESTVYFKDYD